MKVFVTYVKLILSYFDVCYKMVRTTKRERERERETRERDRETRDSLAHSSGITQVILVLICIKIYYDA